MERYEKIDCKSEQKARERISETFGKQANIYAVLDFSVCFGIYEEKNFWMGLGSRPECAQLDWKYLREIRVFDQEKELLLVSSDRGYCGRIRRDFNLCENNIIEKEFMIDEWQKLWGKIKGEKSRREGIPGWSLLVSSRGTKIQIPVDTKEQEEEKALHVRRYMRVPDVEKDEELVFQNDIRMVDFCTWKGDCGDHGEKI